MAEAMEQGGTGYKLVIANKNYSSWSLRGWLAMKQTGAPFEEIVVPLRVPETRELMMRHSPSGKAPCLIAGDVVVWESLAIIEYLAEAFPDAGLWPREAGARAHARAIASEMHAGFMALRKAMPMNIRESLPGYGMSLEGVQADINRIEAIWRDARGRYGAGGDFLFGAFGAADAMYAPVALRFKTYGVTLGENAQTYLDALLAHPPLAEWIAAAKAEPYMIPDYEKGGVNGPAAPNPA
ncbi:MAG: glutathione S-transferase family protein [Alphaproteobacteria bacterium]